jgi:hypothetical protein
MNESETELLAALARVVGVLDVLGVDYLVGGSVASSVFGEPRQTVDADLVAHLLLRHAEPLVSRLGGEFYADLTTIVTAIQTQGCFNLIHLESMTKVDVFVSWRTPFAQSQFARRRKKSVEQCVREKLKLSGSGLFGFPQPASDHWKERARFQGSSCRVSLAMARLWQEVNR